MWKQNYFGLSDKLKHTVKGPHPVTRIHTNGTVTIQLSASTFVDPKFPILSEPALQEMIAGDPVLDPFVGVDPI